MSASAIRLDLSGITMLFRLFTNNYVCFEKKGKIKIIHFLLNIFVENKIIFSNWLCRNQAKMIGRKILNSFDRKEIKDVITIIACSPAHKGHADLYHSHLPPVFH